MEPNSLKLVRLIDVSQDLRLAGLMEAPPQVVMLVDIFWIFTSECVFPPQRKAFEEDRATWLKNQFLNMTPFVDRKRPAKSGLTSASSLGGDPFLTWDLFFLHKKNLSIFHILGGGFSCYDCI